jgi:AraC-type transcriptional regulator N-terminus
MRHRVAEAGPVNEKLASIIGRWTEGVEDRSTPIPNLTLFRREAPTKPALCVVEPSVLLVVQGTKQLVLGKEAYRYDAGRFLITSLDLPANSQTIIASPGKPCLGLALKLDLRMIAELIGLGDPPAPVSDQATGALESARSRRSSWRHSSICSIYSTNRPRSQCSRPFSSGRFTIACC